MLLNKWVKKLCFHFVLAVLKEIDSYCIVRKCSIQCVIFIPRHTIVAGYYGFTLDVRVSVLPSVRQSYVRPSSVRFSFPDDNLSKHQCIFTKLGMCIDIVEIWFRLLMGKFRHFLRSYLPETNQYFCFRMITGKCQGILTKLGTCIDMKEIWFWIAYEQISSVFDRVICPRHDNIHNVLKANFLEVKCN